MSRQGVSGVKVRGISVSCVSISGVSMRGVRASYVNLSGVFAGSATTAPFTSTRHDRRYKTQHDAMQHGET